MALPTERLPAFDSGALHSGMRGQGLAPADTLARHRQLDPAAAMGHEASQQNRLPDGRR